MIWDGFRLAVSLLSVLPLRARQVTRRTSAVAMAVTPAVGLLLGAAGAATLSAADHVLRLAPLLSAVLALAAFTLLVQVAALAQAEVRGHGPIALVAAAVTGRLAIAWACRRGVAAARAQGMGALVAGTLPPVIAVAITAVVLGLAGVVAVVLPSPSGGWLLPVGIAAGLAASLAVARHAVARLGGITGDVLGALTEIGTAACLIVMAA